MGFRTAVVVGVLAQVTACVDAFVAAPLQQRGGFVPVAPSAASPALVSPVSTLAAASAAPPASGHAHGNALLAGAFVAVVAAVLLPKRADARGSRIGLCGWTREPAYPGMERDGDPSRGPAYRTWVNLRRSAKHGNGKRQRYFRQQKILKEAGITCASVNGWTKWYPNQEAWNLYKGPDSHPDNPHFPAASGGLRVPGTPRAVPVAAPMPGLGGALPISMASAGSFVAGRVPTLASAKRSVRDVPRPARSGLVLKAHKKAASSTKNQGSHNNARHWGLTSKAYQGNAVKAGQVLCRQKGLTWYPGKNVVRGRNDTLHALKDGIVQWRGQYKHREVFVVPWEYVREKCQWINPNTLGPKVYEPWMGTRDHGKRHHILKLRREWLDTEEGKAWMAKKKEKQAKQKEIQKKIRAHTLARRFGEKFPKKETVDAGAESSEGESEA